MLIAAAQNRVIARDRVIGNAGSLESGMAEIRVSKKILEYLKKDNSNHFSVTETPDGYLIKVTDPEIQRQLDMALKLMDEYEETLRMLAKGDTSPANASGGE